MATQPGDDQAIEIAQEQPAERAAISVDLDANAGDQVGRTYAARLSATVPIATARSISTQS